MIGILKESQKRINRAALSEESISSPPAKTFGWLQTSPTTSPLIRAKPTTIFLANSFCTSINESCIHYLLNYFTNIIRTNRIQMEQHLLNLDDNHLYRQLPYLVAFLHYFVVNSLEAFAHLLILLLLFCLEMGIPTNCVMNICST